MEIKVDEFIKMTDTICDLKTKVNFYESILGRTQDMISMLDEEDKKRWMNIFDSIQACKIKSAYFWN